MTVLTVQMTEAWTDQAARTTDSAAMRTTKG